MNDSDEQDVKLPVCSPQAGLIALLGCGREELRTVLAEMGTAAYRADQILEWVYGHRVDSFATMSNLGKALREQLGARFVLYESRVAAEAVSADGTRKLLLAWADGQTCECVLIPDGQRQTACISTQVGCPVGCVFCASGLGGVQRNLTAAQMVEQVLRCAALCAPETRLSNVVVMGSGEPLANYTELLSALRIINADWGLGIGARRITVSTVGLPKQIRRLADEQMQINLAVSLHAPDDELRARLIPWAEGVRIADLIAAMQYYFERTGRELTVEYVLLGGINDGRECAEALARICRQVRCNVNLIRYNPVPELSFVRPTAEEAQAFLECLRERGINAHLRRGRGQDIDGACGQLRRRTAGPVKAGPAQ